MDAEQHGPKREGRPSRAEVTQNERRRRKGGTMSALHIPQEVIDNHPDMEFRWGSDDGVRMQALTVNDDWDKVPGVEPIHGGKGDDGVGFKQHLLMKPKAFMEQDRAEKLEGLLARNQEQLSHVPASQATGAEELYAVPGNKI